MGAAIVVIGDVICSYLNVHKLNNTHAKTSNAIFLHMSSLVFSLKLHCFLSNGKLYCHFRIFQSLIKYSEWRHTC